MTALIVYDSVFGNTERIALAMAQALPAEMAAQAIKVGQVQPGQLNGLQLLLVGSPTRAFRPTPAAVQWLKGLPAGSLANTRVSAFDTRIAPEEIKNALLRRLISWLGYAEKGISAQLRRAAGVSTVPSAGFFVLAAEGPLKEGELGRAAQWAQELARGL